MGKQFGPDESPEVFDERDYRPPRKRKIRLDKPNYADFRETRDGKQQLTCECGSQVWQLWDDQVAACGTCGLPEPTVQFSIRDAEEAEKFLEIILG